MNDVDVLIIGGGISGLAAAWWLAQQGASVEIWEAASRPGGKILSTQKDGYLMERSAAMLMNFRPEVTGLVRESGLESAKTPRQRLAESHRYLLHQGCLTALPMRLGPMLVSPLWSLRGKLRLLAEPFIPCSGREDETVSDFITHRLGREMLEKAVEPFVAGTLASDPNATSAAAALPRLVALERRYGSITAGIFVNRVLRRRSACATDTFSFQGGMGTLVATLAQTPGVKMRTSHSVDELIREQGAWRVTAATPDGQRCVSSRHVIVATPASVTASLVAQIDSELAELLHGIKYAAVTVVHMGVDRHRVDHPLDGTGFLAPGRESTVLTGNLWMSSLFPGRAPPGKVLLTSYLGGMRAPQAINWNDERIVGQALKDLRPLIGLKADPDMVRIDRHREALPVYHGAYQKRMQAIESRLQNLPGLHLEANYRGGVSVRDRLVRGRAVAKQILGIRQEELPRDSGMAADKVGAPSDFKGTVVE